MIRCISKNILADIYAIDQKDGRYDFIDDKSILEMSHRLPLLIDQINGYDVILLQEVELKDIKLISNLLPEYDYHSHVISKNRKNIIGNMTLWKKSIELIENQSNSTTVFTVLKFNDVIFTIGNAHFHTGRDHAAIINRSNQMKSTVKMLNKLKVDRIILAGDFNDSLSNFVETRETIINANLIITDIKPTCYTWSNKDQQHYYTSIDRIVFIGVEIEIGYIPENRPIPDEIEPSDHFAVPFDIIF